MPVLERVYTVPLRKAYLSAPRHKRAQRAMHALRSFLSRHMKSETILFDTLVNEYVWQRGMKNPPHHIRVKAVKEEDGTVRVTLEEERLRGKPVGVFTRKRKKAAETHAKKDAKKDAKSPVKADIQQKREQDAAEQKKQEPQRKKGQEKVKGVEEVQEGQTTEADKKPEKKRDTRRSSRQADADTHDKTSKPRAKQSTQRKQGAKKQGTSSKKTAQKKKVPQEDASE